jgi:probable HAF family extracellular repeat protein
MKALILSVVLIGAAAGAAAAGYEIRTLDFPGATSTELFALNDAAQIVGAEKDKASLPHAIVLQDGRLRLLDPNGVVGKAVRSWAFSINNRSDIAGAYIDAAGSFHGYVHHRDGTIDPIEYPGGFDTQAFGINDLGSVIGVYNDSAGNPHAFVLRDGVYKTTDIAGGLQTIPLSINDREETAGEYITTANTNGFGYVQQKDGTVSIVTAPGSAPQQTFFISINNRDQILGAYANATVAQQNFLVTGSVYALFDLPASFGATFVSAQTVNDKDQIVGLYQDAAGAFHGFLAVPESSEKE